MTPVRLRYPFGKDRPALAYVGDTCVAQVFPFPDPWEPEGPLLWRILPRNGGPMPIARSYTEMERMVREGMER